jgi:hypothetical protein
MFGYIRPHYPELRGKEITLYRAAYCGLCHTLSKRYGMTARFLVNYDFVLPALLFWDGDISTTERRCIKNPFRKHTVLAGHPSLDYAADALMLLTRWKLKDTIDDSHFPLPARMVLAFYKRKFRKAAERLRLEDSICSERMKEIRQLEKKNDRNHGVAKAFGEMLAGLSYFREDVDDRRAAHSLFYHLGRWLTFIDAAEDMERDEKRGMYNTLTEAGISREDAFGLMKWEHELAIAAFDLLEENAFSEIIRNILSLGLQARGHEIYKKCKLGGGVPGDE